jgi:hypothetical protein
MRAEILAGKWTMLEKELSSEAQVFCTISSRLLALSSSCYSLLGQCAFFFPLHSPGLHSKYRLFLLPYTTLQKRVPEEHIKHIRWLVLGQNHVHEGKYREKKRISYHHPLAKSLSLFYCKDPTPRHRGVIFEGLLQIIQGAFCNNIISVQHSP